MILPNTEFLVSPKILATRNVLVFTDTLEFWRQDFLQYLQSTDVKPKVVKKDTIVFEYHSDEYIVDMNILIRSLGGDFIKYSRGYRGFMVIDKKQELSHQTQDEINYIRALYSDNLITTQVLKNMVMVWNPSIDMKSFKAIDRL